VRVGADGGRADIQGCQVFTGPLNRYIALGKPVYTQRDGLEKGAGFSEVTGEGYFGFGESRLIGELEYLELGPGF